jgi:hypothetical protein
MFKIPNELKEFSVWLNPTNLKVIDKFELLKLVPTLLTAKADLINLDDQCSLSNGLGNNKNDLAIFALRVYFYQIFHSNQFSLDLRPTNFSYDEFWRFQSTKLVFSFTFKFIEGLRETYQCYYLKEGKGLRKCLLKMGLMNDQWSEADKKELEGIFLNHFSIDSQTKQLFQFNDLLSSFGKIFFFIKSKNGKVPMEFAPLGVYLSSLYKTLELSSERLDVKAAFLFKLP